MANKVKYFKTGADKETVGLRLKKLEVIPASMLKGGKENG